MFKVFSQPIPQISTQEVEQQLSSPRPPLIVDVREPAEYAQGHIPGSLLIPLGELPQHFAELPRDREIVVVCRSGNRSATATLLMKEAGLTARNMVGGMLGWRGQVER